MQDILRHLDAYQERIGNSAAISPSAFSRLNDMANKLRSATVSELTGRVQRIDPGMDERARQAVLQGGADGGYLPVRRAMEEGSC